MTEALRTLVPIFAVAVGGCVGAVARFLIGSAFAERETRLFVLTGTVIANGLGCLLIGVLVAAVPKEATLWRLGLITGLLGSLTTFSTYSYETVSLLERRQYAPAAANAIGSVLLGLVAVAAGLWIGRRLRGE